MLFRSGSHILRDVSFEANLGRITVLLGRNGVGKTTLLKSLMGAVPIRDGSITFSGDIDASGLAGLRRIAQGTSLLVFNSVVLDPPGSPDVLYTLHTPPKAIGEVADAVRAGQLLLSHLSPALDAQRDAVKASIAAHYAGGVVFAQDGQRLAP